MFSHVTLGCSDIGASARFYDAAPSAWARAQACGAGWRSRSRMLDQTGETFTVLCVHAV